MCHPCLRSRNSCVTSLRADYAGNILETFLHRRNLFFYSIYLFISIQTHGYLFLVWLINQDYFIACSNYSSFGHWGLFGLTQCPLSSTYMSMKCLFECLFFFSISFLYGTVRCSWLTLYISCPSHFSKGSGSFYQINSITNQIWAVGMLTTAEVSFLLSLSADKTKKYTIYRCISTSNNGMSPFVFILC